MDIRFALKGAVVFVIACGCLSAVAERDILERYKPNKDNPKELNDFLANVRKYKEDFQWIRRAADMIYAEQEELEAKAKKKSSGRRAGDDDGGGGDGGVGDANYDLIEANQPAENGAFPSFLGDAEEAVDYGEGVDDYEGGAEPQVYGRNGRSSWRDVKKRKYGYRMRKRRRRRRRGLDLNDYNVDHDRRQIAEVRVVPRSDIGFVQVPGVKYHLYARGKRRSEGPEVVARDYDPDSRFFHFSKDEEAGVGGRQKESVRLGIIDDDDVIKEIKRDEAKHSIVLTLKNRERSAANDSRLVANDYMGLGPQPSTSLLKDLDSHSEDFVVTPTSPQQITDPFLLDDSMYRTAEERALVAQNGTDSRSMRRRGFRFFSGRSQTANANVPEMVNDYFKQTDRIDTFKKYELEAARKGAGEQQQHVNRLEEQSEPTSALEQRLLSTRYNLDGTPGPKTQTILGLMILPSTTDVPLRGGFRIKETEDMVHAKLDDILPSDQKQRVAAAPASSKIVVKKESNGPSDYRNQEVLGLDRIDVAERPTLVEERSTTAPSPSTFWRPTGAKPAGSQAATATATASTVAATKKRRLSRFGGADGFKEYADYADGYEDVDFRADQNSNDDRATAAGGVSRLHRQKNFVAP